MRIVVLDIAASKTGALSVLQDFAACVREKGQGQEWIFVTGVPGLLTESEEAPHLKVRLRSDVKRSKADRLRFDRLEGASYLSSLQPDVVFSLQNTLPSGTEKLFRKDGEKVRTVLYVHQPLGFQKWKRFSFFRPGEREAALYQHLISREIDRSIRRADLTIVQTAWMKEAVMEKLRIPGERILRILPDVQDLSACEKPELKWDKNSFLFPAGPIYYKNHICILQAAELLKKKGYKDFRILFTVKKEELPWIGEEFTAQGNSADRAEPVRWAGALPREELMSLYQTSTLLFPSYVETFGFPPAEARQFGVPILAADMPFCREVLEGYQNARYFNPFDPAALAEEMEKVLRGELRKEEAAASGEKEEKKSSWERVMEVLTEE